jgi:hypothetical protein
MIASSRNFAIGMAHFQISGGLRMLIASLVVYLVMIGGGATLYGYYDMGSQQSLNLPLSAILTIMLAVEGVVLVVFGGMQVSSAIRTDLTLKMIESHRLMPVSSWRAVMGYLFGAPTHSLAFALLNVLITLLIGLQAGVKPATLLTNHAILIAFAAFIWSFALLGTFLYRHIFIVALGAMLFGTCTNLIALAYILFPAIALLLTPFIGDTAFSFSTTSFTSTHALAIAGQAGLFAVFFAAACRRYRGTYKTTFSAALAMVLLALCAGIMLVSLANAQNLMPARWMMFFGPMRRGFGGMGGRVPLQTNFIIAQIVAALAACSLLAILPAWGLVREPWRIARTPLAAAATAGMLLLTAVLAATPALGAPEDMYSRRAFFLSILVILAHVLTVFLGLRLLRNVRGIVLGWTFAAGLAALWIGPMLLEAARLLLFDNGAPVEDFRTLNTLSPLGMLVNLWLPSGSASPIPGLIWQWLVVVALAAISLVQFRKAQAGTSGASMAAPTVTAPEAP